MFPSSHAESADQARRDARVEEVSLERLRDGDRRAFEGLFHEYYEALYNFAYGYVRRRETAEELVQDVFCRLWERQGALPAPTGEHGFENVRAYLYRAVRNAALSWLRHHRVEQRLYVLPADDLRPPGMGAGPPGAEAAVQSDEAKAALRRAVAALPEPYRQVLALRSDHQLSYPEIATILGVPLKTVESRITRAFKALREALAAWRPA